MRSLLPGAPTEFGAIVGSYRLFLFSVKSTSEPTDLVGIVPNVIIISICVSAIQVDCTVINPLLQTLIFGLARLQRRKLGDEEGHQQSQVKSPENALEIEKKEK